MPKKAHLLHWMLNNMVIYEKYRKTYQESIRNPKVFVVRTPGFKRCMSRSVVWYRTEIH